MKYYTYTYIDPRTNQPFYVGKGQNKRCYDHLKRSYGSPVPRIAELKMSGLAPIIQVEFWPTEEDAYMEEMWSIYKYGRQDRNNGPLLNKSNGGSGGSGCPKPSIRSEKQLQHLRHMAKSNLGKTVGPMTPERKANIAKAKLGAKAIRIWCIRCRKDCGINNMSRHVAFCTRGNQNY